MSDPIWISPSLSSEWLSDATDNTAEVVDALATSVGAVSKLLNKIASLVLEGQGLITNLVGRILSFLTNLVEDVLNTGVSACAHTNLKIDPDWTTSKYFKEGKAPFRAGGLTEWLAEVAVASMDEANPYAPTPDDDQPMAAILLIKGVNVDAIDSLASLIRSCRGLTNIFPSNGVLNTVEGATDDPNTPRWKKLISVENGRSHARVGAIEETPENTSDTKGKIKEALFDSPWEEKFGVSPKSFTMGQPSWYSVKISDALGTGIADFLREIKKLVSHFKIKGVSNLSDLLDSIALYLNQVQAILSKLSSFIKLIDDFINTILSIDMCIVPFDSQAPTGMTGLVKRIIESDDLPDYGANGVVIGTMYAFQGVNTSSFTAFTSLFSFLGIDISSYFGAYAQGYKDAWTEATGDITDAWAGTSLVNKNPEWVSPTVESPVTYKFNVVSGTTSVGTLQAFSPNTPASTLSYSITGGRDQYHAERSPGVLGSSYTSGQSIFFINSSTGLLSFVTAPDFNYPTASVSGNVYRIEVSASDSVDITSCIVEITVTSA